jgi:hypothetical protein
MSRPDYRPYLPSPAQSKIAGPTARAHAAARTASPRARELFGGWDALFRQAFAGITTDGTPIPGLFSLQPNGAPTEAMIAAATALVARRRFGASGRTPSSMSRITACASTPFRTRCARR